MPDEDKTQIEQEKPEDESAQEPMRQFLLPLKKYGLYAVAVLAMIIAAYFVTSKVVKPIFTGGSSGQATAGKTKKPPDREKGDKNERRTSPGNEAAAGEGTGEVFLIEDIIVNPAGTGGRRFLSASVGFELVSPQASDLMMSREAIVRDALITILSSQSIPQLSDFKHRERLRQLIKLRVQNLLHTEEVAAVYFTEFVLQ